jgi:hypothetical protein
MSILHAGLQWQGPVCTELAFYKKNHENPLFIGFPWAQALDGKIDLAPFLKTLTKTEKAQSYTCCQHIHFRRMIPTMKLLGIQILYTPHKILKEDVIQGVTILPCPLYAVNIEDVSRNSFFTHAIDLKFPLSFDPTDLVHRPRKYLYSFMGAYQKQHYLSDIRKKLYENHSKQSPPHTVVIDTGDWHFNGVVYGAKTVKRDLTTDLQDYNQLLLDSTFSLCPSGSGPNSIRLWESLAVGSIPILLADTLELSEHPLWEKAILRVNERTVKENPMYLYQLTHSFKPETLIEMRKNCLQLYRELRI